MFMLEAKRRLVLAGWPFFIVCLLFYFTYHVISGEKGVLSMIRLQEKLLVAEQELTEVNAERSRIEQRVDRMYSTSLDTDLLDEQARKTLGRAAEGEVIYMVKPQTSVSDSPVNVHKE